MRNSFSPLFLLGVFFWTKTVHGFLIGSCSRSCHQNSDRALEFDIPLHKCYCSPGCNKFGDCCFDYEHRSQGRPLLSKSLEMCFQVKGKGYYRAIAECPDSSCFDVDLPPVTSRLTNLTYANRNCAACHEDSVDLITWDAILKCCKKHLNRVSLYEQGEPGELGYKGLFQKKGRKSYCTCEYDMTNEAFLEVSRLDLRPCKSDSKFISRCESMEDPTCPSYEDPVFVRNRLFKNIHCAICSNERKAYVEGALCVSEQISGNSTVMQNCQEKGVVACVESNSVRGRPGSLKTLLTGGNPANAICYLGPNIQFPCRA